MIKVLLVDIAGVYRPQGLTSWMEEAGVPFEAANVEGIEGTHCYCDGEAEKEILKALDRVDDCKLRFIGSGDYHYISCLLAQNIREPFSLVLMDHHPDNQAPALGNVLSCGGWVNDLKARCPALEDVLTIGPEGCPQDIPEGWLKSHGNVYVSLDKDIMLPQYAVTGWTQGKHTLEDVKRMLGKIFESGANVLAVDICGECAPDACQAVNLETNTELLNHIIKTLNV